MAQETQDPHELWAQCLLNIERQGSQLVLTIEKFPDSEELKHLVRDLFIKINPKDVLFVGSRHFNENKTLFYRRQTGTNNFEIFNLALISETTKLMYRKLMENKTSYLWIGKEQKIDLQPTENDGQFDFGNTTSEVVFDDSQLLFSFVNSLSSCEEWENIRPSWRPPPPPPLPPLPRGIRETATQRERRNEEWIKMHLNSKIYRSYVRIYEEQLKTACHESGLIGLNREWKSEDSIPRKVIDDWVEKYRSLIRDEYFITTTAGGFSIQLKDNLELNYRPQ